MQKDEGTKSYAAVYLFFEHNPSPPLPLNALHRNALQARQKKKWRGNASRCYIPRHRCGQMLCKQRVQHAIPSPSSVTQTGHDHFAAIIHRREHLCAPVRAPPPRFFPRRQPPALCTHALKNVLSRRSFPPPRFADEKRSSSIYFTSPSPLLFHEFVRPPLLSRTSLDSGVSFL